MFADISTYIGLGMSQHIRDKSGGSGYRWSISDAQLNLYLARLVLIYSSCSCPIDQSIPPTHYSLLTSISQRCIELKTLAERECEFRELSHPPPSFFYCLFAFNYGHCRHQVVVATSRCLKSLGSQPDHWISRYTDSTANQTI